MELGLGSDLPTNLVAYEIVSDSGALDAPGWNAGNLASAGGGSGSPADVDGSGLVDGADFLEIQRMGGSLIPDWKADYGTAGGGSLGEQWEVLNATDQQLFEAYLLGNTLIDIGASQAIGNGYNTSVGTEDLTFFYRTDAGVDLEGTVTYVGGGLTAVPEPAGLALAALMAIATGARWRRRRGPFLAVVATLLLLASAVENSAVAQLANPLSSADGYDDSGNAGYTLSAIASPVVTSIAGTDGPLSPRKPFDRQDVVNRRLGHICHFHRIHKPQRRETTGQE